MTDLNARIVLLDQLLEQPRQGLSSEDYQEAQIILTGLTDEQRKEVLQTYYEKNLFHFFFVEKVLKRSLPNADFSKKVETNTPVSELLANFRNRKKVVESRRELVRRYEYLDPAEQLSLRLALLQSPTVSDHITGCKYAMERWDGQELPLVEAIWHKAQENGNYDRWYWSSRLLLRHAPKEFLSEQKEQLTRLRSEEVKALYYYLALRLHDEPTFSLQKERLRIGDYYRILFYSGSSFDENEWLEDFFRAMAEIYIFSAHYFAPYLQWSADMQPDVPRKLTKADEFIPAPHWFTDKPRNEVSLSHLSTIRTMLLYGAQQGCNKLDLVLHYLHEVEDRMIEEATHYPTHEFPGWPADMSWEQWLYWKSQAVVPCVEQLIYCCPEPFLHCFDERIQLYKEWLAPLSEKWDTEAIRHLKDTLGLTQVIEIETFSPQGAETDTDDCPF